MSGHAEFAPNGSNIVLFNYPKTAFGYKQCLGGDIASNENLATEMTALNIQIRAIVAHQTVETLRRHVVANLLVNFAYHTLKVGRNHLAHSTGDAAFYDAFIDLRTAGLRTITLDGVTCDTGPVPFRVDVGPIAD